MDDRLRRIIRALRFTGPPASAEMVERLTVTLGVALPAEYLELLREVDGCEGPVGEHGYAVVYSVDRAIVRNDGDLIGDDFPGVIVFASDGGDVAYAYDMRSADVPIVETSFSDPTEFPPRIVARSLLEWFEYMISYDPAKES